MDLESGLSSLRNAIRDDVRKIYNQLRNEASGDTYYVFAIFDYVDYSCPTLFYSANTEQHFAERSTSGDVSVEIDRWHPCYWGTHGDLATAAQLLNDVIEESGLAEDDDYDSLFEFGYKVRAEMVVALRELDTEGLFGTGDERNRLLLTVSTNDEASTDDWTHLESARVLNSESAFRHYLAELQRVSQEKCLAKDAETIIREIDEGDLVQRVNRRASS